MLCHMSNVKVSIILGVIVPPETNKDDDDRYLIEKTDYQVEIDPIKIFFPII